MRILKALRFVAGFGTARGMLFFAPIILANLLPLERYGQFELAQSWASIGALVIGCGLPGTVPLIRLRDEIEGRWDTLLLLVAAISLACLTLALVAVMGLGTLYAVPVLVAVAVGTLMLQGLWATTLKSEGRSTGAVFVEAGFWVFAVLGAGLAMLAGGALPPGMITAALLAYAAILMALTLREVARHRAPFTLCDFRRNLALGLPLMITGVLSVIVTSSGRLVLGQTSGVAVVGLYAILYRSTMLSLVGHQILTIGYFRQIFSWSDEVLRARASVIVLGVTGMVLAFWLLEPFLGFLLGQRFVETFPAHRTEGLMLLVQTILWSAVALNDLINSRLQIAGRVTRVTAPFLAFGLGALWLWTTARAESVGIDALLNGFILGHFALMAGFYAVQCAASAALGHRFTRLWLTVAACTAGAGALILVGETLR